MSRPLFIPFHQLFNTTIIHSLLFTTSLLDQFPFFVGGAGLGTAYALYGKRGNIMPLLVGGMVGSVADLVYGYTVKCVTQVNATKQSKSERND